MAEEYISIETLRLWHEQEKENIELQKRIKKAINKIQYIIDYGFDYDGFNNIEDLNMLIDYAVQTKNILKGE